MNIDASNTPLEFPGDHPLKVVGKATPEFRARMLQIVALHGGGTIEPSRVTEKLSRDGTYVSLTCVVRAESREHLDRIYREMHATGLVLYAL
jgi:putative lipoic acid-binding regulatory protein